MGIYAMVTILQKEGISNVYFLLPGFGINNEIAVGIQVILGLGCTSLVFYMMGKKGDVL